MQMAKLLGAKVIGTTSNMEKAKRAIENGCDHVILYTNENVVEKVMEYTNKEGVECVYDGVGKSTFDTSLACLKRLGTLCSFGNASGKVGILKRLIMRWMIFQ